MGESPVTSEILTQEASGFRRLDDSGEILTTRRLTIASGFPRWQFEALARLAELERLPPNWDGYGARPVSRRHANRALSFLGRLMTDALPLPEIGPLPDGGVQLEWHLDGSRVDFISDVDEPQPVLLLETPGVALEQVEPSSEAAVHRARELLLHGVPRPADV